MSQKSTTGPTKGLDVYGAVEELHNLSAKEMNKLLRDSQHLFTLRIRTGRGSFLRVNLDRLLSRLPLHLLACLASRGTEPRLRYLLRGVRLLHSFSDLALRHPKLEQSFLHEVKIREQILDLIIYMLVTLAGPEQEGRHGSSFTILHAALVACSLHLLPAFVAGEWSDLVPVLLVHPKVDIFMDAAFDAVARDIGLLQTKLRVLNAKLMSSRVSSNVAESMAEVIAQQCEASVQVLLSLCQPQAFRDKVLNHKELCRNGGVLNLVLAVLKLQVPFLLAESKYLVSLVARLKSKILSLLVKFCETESVSFLDEVAADVGTMRLAEMVAEEVFILVRKALVEENLGAQESDDENNHDDETLSSLLYIHALRMADIFSDDSNFRNSVMDFIAPDLARVLAQSPTTFSSNWCSSSTAKEIKAGSDSVLIYDPFRAAGAAMHSFKSSGGSSSRASGTANALLPDDSSGCSLSVGQLQFASYSQERSSLFVKILANLHCFNPEICPANEKDRFLNMFVGCLMAGPFTPGNSAFFLSKVQTAVRVCENLFWLLDYVSSLSSDIVSDEDLQLVSTFYCALHDSICPSAVFEDPCEEDPVVAYVRDGHERKRKDFLNRWQQSERWKRIHSFEPSDDKEHSNAGSSVHKSMSNTSSPQAIEEQDTNELVKNCYEVPMTKRARDLSDREEGMGRTQKRQQTYQQSFIESTLMDWTAQQAELYGKKKSLHSEVEKHYGEIGLMNVDERMDLGNSGSSTLKPKVEYLDSDIRNSSTDFSHEEVQESAETCSTYNEAHLSSEREIHRSGMQNMENVGRDPCRDISACKEIKPPDKDGTPLDADGSVNMDSVTEVDGKALGLNDENLQNELSSSQIKGNAYRTLEINIESEKYTNFHIDKAVSNNESSIMHMEASLLKKKSEHLMTPNNDLQEFLEGAGVESTAETDSSGIEASNPVHNQTADSEIEKSNTVFKIKLEAIDVTGEIATDAHSKFRETREIGDTQLSTEAQCEHHDTSGNNGSKPKLCVQHGIDLKFELKVEDLEVFVNAVRHQAQRSDPFGSEENRLQISNGFSHDKLINALQIDVMQLQNKDGKQSRDTLNEESSKASFCEVPQLFVGSKASQPSIMEPPLSLPRPLHMDAVGMFCISGPGTTQMSSPPSSQLPIHKDSLMHASNASRNTALDASCFPEIKTCGIGLGHSMPRPLQRVPSSIIEPKKRKRNIMNDEQMAMIENALLSEPYLRRHPDLIMQWTNKLNEIGPEISYQQLKNWLNNRKARLARQRAGESHMQEGELQLSAYNLELSGPGTSTFSGSSNDPNKSTSEDGANVRDTGSTCYTRKALSKIHCAASFCKLASEDTDTIMDYDIASQCRSKKPSDLNAEIKTAEEGNAYAKLGPDSVSIQGASHRLAQVKFVKCETGQYVSLLGEDGREAATGTLHQVEGFWQGKRIDEQGICIVRILNLKVEKTTRLPHPSAVTGSTFEEAEKLCGHMIVAWDTKRIFLIS